MKTIARIMLVLSPLALGACVNVERQPAEQPAHTTVVVPPNTAPTTTVVCTAGAPPPCY